ncbi:MAG: hypothetical protein ACFFG0_48805 [Candidatus Thorarchaeota archaeon]
MYKPEDIELPASFKDIENLHNHKFFREHLKKPPFKKAFLRESTEDEIRKIISLTYTSIG